MRSASLRWLCCPAPGCAGELVVLDRPAPTWDAGREELLEGVLACRSCSAGYPVLLGVAILVPEHQHYLWSLWTDIETCAQQTPEGAISGPMSAWLGVARDAAEPIFAGEDNLDWTIAPYLQAYFDRDSLSEGLPRDWLAGAIDAYAAGSHNPYSLLTTAVEELGAGAGLAIEMGCNAGKVARTLAANHDYSVGTDWSFRAVLAARRHLLGQPSPAGSYPREGERGRHDMVPLPGSEAPDNLDFVVADGSALPAAAGAASCLAALNVICAVPDARLLTAEFHRAAAPGGLLLVSSPYWSDSPPGQVSMSYSEPEDLRAALAGGFEIVLEDLMVPWVLRLAKRRLNIYLCHCVVARRLPT
ncbi:MAG: methyltransferase domain-containing protein [Actinomycetota bacterium]